MLRRSFLTALGALPFTSDRLTRRTTPPLPREEDCRLWWRYVHHGIKIGDPKYCTDQFLDMVVMRSQLDHTTDNEARRVMRAAFRGAYDTIDVPVKYRPSEASRY